MGADRSWFLRASSLAVKACRGDELISGFLSLLLGFAILYGCFSAGRYLLSLINPDLRAPEEAVFAAASGLGLIAYLILGVGLLGFLTPTVLWGIAGALGVTALIRFSSDLEILKAVLKPLSGPWTFWGILVWTAGAVCIFTMLTGVLTPEIANDSLCYHLHIPKIYLQNHKIFSIPYDVTSEFPLFMEMLYTFGLGLGGMVLAKFFHFAMGLLLAAGAAISVYRLTQNKKAASWTAALLLTTPVVVNQITTTYVDVALACYSFLALNALFLYSDQPGRYNNLLVFCGIFIGFALSIKYLALITAAYIVLFMISRFKHQPSIWIQNLFLFGIFSLLAGAYWYVHSYLVTGNPVYPYFARVFGSGDATIHYNDIGVAKTFTNFLTVFWTATMKPQIFEGYGVQIGPAYLAFAPAGILLAWKQSRRYALYTLFFLAAWFLLGQSLRFLVPLLPVLALLSGVGLALIMPRGWTGKVFQVLFASVIIFHTALAVYHHRREFKAAAGIESASDYLLKMERSYAPAVWVNANLPKDAKILNADETRMFYFNRTLIRESVYADKELYWTGAKTADGVIASLKKRGFTHILFATRAGIDYAAKMDSMRVPVLFSDPKNRLASSIKELYTNSFTDPESVKTDYYLYQIL